MKPKKSRSWSLFGSQIAKPHIADYATTIKLEIKPPKIGLLTDCDSDQSVLNALSLNTCLWGGKKNPILPIPKLSKDFLSIFRRYNLDYAVNLSGKALRNIPHAIKSNVLDKARFQPAHKKSNLDHLSVSMLPIYLDIYEREFKFLPKTETSNIRIGAITREANAFWYKVAHHGFFANEQDFYRNALTDLCRPKTFNLSSMSTLKFAKDKHPVPISLTMQLLTSCSSIDSSKLIVFVGNGNSRENFLNYWNLKTQYSSLIWIENLTPSWLKELKTWQKRLYAIYPTVHIISDKVLSDKSCQVIASSVNAKKYKVTKPHEPNRIATLVHMTRSYAPANQSTYSIGIPKALFKHTYDDPWSNMVFQLRSDMFHSKERRPYSIRFPYWFREYQIGSLHRGSLIPPPNCSAGIAFSGLRAGEPLQLRLISEEHAVFQVVKEAGFAPRAKVEGLQILKFYEKLSSNFVGLPGNLSFLNYLRQLSEMEIKTIRPENFMKGIKKLGFSQGAPEFILEALIESGWLALGMCFQCPNCRRKDFYRIGKIDRKLNCDQCHLEFSISNMYKSPWLLKKQGILESKNFGQGSYPIMRFMGVISGSLGNHEISLVPQCELFKGRRGKSSHEFDLIGLLNGEFLACEAKDEKGEFGAREFLKFRCFGSDVPEFYALFLTMRPIREVKPGERRRISAVRDAGGVPILLGRDELMEGRVVEGDIQFYNLQGLASMTEKILANT